jgi:predicted NACHT family NTPase
MNEEKSLTIEQSYINLAMVETKEQQEKEKKLKQHDQEKMPERENEQDNHLQQHNDKILGTFEEIYGTKTSIDVTNIFKKCEDQTRKVLILGRAGISKSTFCQYVTYRWAKGEIWSEYELVVLIRLRKLSESRYLSGENYSPVDLVKKEYFPFDDLSNEDKQRFKEQCNTGKVLWILDGYDEFVQNIPEQLKDVFDHVRETQHHILTSRPYAITLSYDVKMEITGFTDDNNVKYVQQFFDQITDEITNAAVQGQKLLTFLKSNPSIGALPMFL